MKRMLCIICFWMLILPYPLLFAQSAPDGFADLKWGSSISDYVQLDGVRPIVIMGDPAGLRYALRDIRRFGDAEINSALYFFFEDKYCSCSIEFSGKSSFSNLKEALINKYGKGLKERPLYLMVNPNAVVGEEISGTIQNTVSITLQWNEIKQNGELRYSFLPIWMEAVRKDKKTIEELKNKL